MKKYIPKNHAHDGMENELACFFSSACKRSSALDCNLAPGGASERFFFGLR